jgi:LmbE family N-acetylglucosaminyl deacetylase
MSARIGSLLAIACILSVLAPSLWAQPLGNTSILLVTAHPDDEALFAGSVYRIARELGGKVDLALITDGAGGYRYATMAERIYGLELTDPDVARQYLPAIRKQELLAGGRIVGFRGYHFLDQPDTGRLNDPDSVLSTIWDADFVLRRLSGILESGRYDFVFTFLPQPEQHGHHKSAAILALRAVRLLPEERRPVILGAWISDVGDESPILFDGLDGYPESATQQNTSSFQFDRTHALADNDRLNYKIPVNWLIAEHKSQGTMQLFVNRGDVEEYWLYRENPRDAAARAESLFNTMNDFGNPSSPSDEKP